MEILVERIEKFLSTHDILVPRPRCTSQKSRSSMPDRPLQVGSETLQAGRCWLVTEEAEQFQVTSTTIRRWIKAGKLRAQARGIEARLSDPGIGNRPPAARVERADPERIKVAA